MIPPIIVIGGGGHAKVLIESLQLQKRSILGITDSNENKKGSTLFGVPIIGDDNMILQHPPKSIQLVNGIGAVQNTTVRGKIFNFFKKHNYSFAQVIHPSCILSPDIELSEGVQMMAGTIIQPGTLVGSNTIINTKTTIDHDCTIGDHVHLAPGVTINGAVQIHNGVLIGTGATILQTVSIGENSIIGAGSVVIDDVPNDVKMVGIPANLI